jgi:hypothetical protein
MRRRRVLAGLCRRSQLQGYRRRVCWASRPSRSASLSLVVTCDPLNGWLVDPCIGFIIHEPATLPAPRKLVILGDTSSAAGLTPLVSSTPGRLSLLVHEATDAHMPEDIDPRFAARGPFAVIAAKSKERGHSTPPEAGTYAGKWGARQLVLNHIGTRWVYLFLFLTAVIHYSLLVVLTPFPFPPLFPRAADSLPRPLVRTLEKGLP